MKSVEQILKQIQLSMFTSMYELRFNRKLLTSILQELIDGAYEEGRRDATAAERNKYYRTLNK